MWRFVEAYDIERAREIADLIPDMAKRACTRAEIDLILCINDSALSLAEQGYVEEAKEKIRTMPHSAGKVLAVRAIAYPLAIHGRIEEVKTDCRSSNT